jgi:hypothetical protein
LELLIVIAIIGLLSFLALPAIKNISKSDVLGAANRQLLDDVSYARRLAVRNRATVYMVFLPSQYTGYGAMFTGPDQAHATDLLGMQYNGYAMFTWRRVGEQPGQNHPTYLRDWQTLPQGIFIPEWKYTTGNGGVAPFRTAPIPFPNANSQLVRLPYVAFNYQGQLVQFDPNGNPTNTVGDEVIPLARGALFFPTDPNTKDYLWQSPQITENPPGNSINNYNHVRIDWLTGRAKLERPEIR